MQQTKLAWVVAGFATLLALVLADELSGITIAGTFAVVPLITILGGWPFGTLVAGGAATVLALAVSIGVDAPAEATAIRSGGVAVATGVAWMVVRRLHSDRQRLGRVRRVAEVAQLAVLTPVPASAGAYSLASVYVSASKEALIGGDLYGVVDSPFGLRLIVGDVRGKGLDAVSLAATTLTTFRELAGSAADLCDIARRLDTRLTPRLGVEDFVTAVLAGLCDDGSVDLVNCGHPPPLVLHGPRLEWLETAIPTSPLGLDPDPALQRFVLEPGERLLFYTDGLVEARARYGGFIDLDAALDGVAAAPMDSALPGVLRRVREQSGDELRDDTALLLVEYSPPPAPA